MNRRTRRVIDCVNSVRDDNYCGVQRSVREISLLLDMSETTINNLLSSAMEKMKVGMGRYHNEI